ncbi:GDP-mannose 4,6-dehydratase, partial [Candidatus Parcubacteria bacterium]|nr:GDP-mannose 4,6-dehydratase [Candidatus Parcubacteria bacterium]
ERDTQGIFNIGSGKEISVLELIDVLEKINNKKFEYKHYKERIGEVRRSVLDCNKARELLNWRAKTDIKEGLKKTIDYFKNVLSL